MRPTGRSWIDNCSHYPNSVSLDHSGKYLVGARETSFPIPNKYSRNASGNSLTSDMPVYNLFCS